MQPPATRVAMARRRGFSRPCFDAFMPREIHAHLALWQQRWLAEQVLLMADLAEVAMPLYKALGCSEIESPWSLQRNAPQARKA